jgi:XTP/dITP diphosphohydrolase
VPRFARKLGAKPVGQCAQTGRSYCRDVRGREHLRDLALLVAVDSCAECSGGIEAVDRMGRVNAYCGNRTRQAKACRHVYCATSNPAKLREFRMASAVEPLPNLAYIPAPKETGDTFEANAVQKALYYSKHSPHLLFAEDSGLEVDALNGQPGVFSARFAGPNASDEENNRLLLERMQGVRNRTARFVAVVALASSGELVKVFRGSIEGFILDSPRGSSGFGYDPVFYYPPFQCSLGEAPLERKMQVSHRGQALREMLLYLRSSGTPASA